ncbi:MAG: HPr family phosphocarrier protein [Desulfosporosinus sp.]|nr:HPr family phosphocarrier protein [Desulfosporosinus sp.]
MIQKEYRLNNLLGLHARPASLLVQVASEGKSEVTLIKKEKEYNAKSILGVLSLGAQKGDDLLVRIDGLDEVEIERKIQALFAGNFRE